MNSFLKWVGLTLAIAVVSHFIFVAALPTAIMTVLLGRGSQQIGMNAVAHPPKIDKDSRLVVRPAPDLAYSTCVYDVTDGAVITTLHKSATYASVSFFADDTVNFFALNDREVVGERMEVVLVRAGDTATVIPQGAIRIEAPSNKGLVLWRRVIPSDAAWSMIDEQRRLEICKRLGS